MQRRADRLADDPIGGSLIPYNVPEPAHSLLPPGSVDAVAYRPCARDQHQPGAAQCIGVQRDMRVIDHFCRAGKRDLPQQIFYRQQGCFRINPRGTKAKAQAVIIFGEVLVMKRLDQGRQIVHHGRGGVRLQVGRPSSDMADHIAMYINGQQP